MSITTARHHGHLIRQRSIGSSDGSVEGENRLRERATIL